ncbi:hypothetical protein [Halorussus caseinilyticus]|uniref:Amidohydrolase-related domain-containing protein n=1 Tax=Halorussus caseinilyticus TaxID=3034025 RepID=A0ABD5WKS9_9EURY
MNDLQSVALGEESADLVITGGRVCLPEVGEFQSRDVVIVDDRVAALPEDADPVIGDDTRVVTASNRVVAPGFVDAHTHLDLHQTFENAYHYAIEGGTTTVVSEVTGYGPAFGAEGVEQFLAATSYLPVRVRAVVPPHPLLDTFEPAGPTTRRPKPSWTCWATTEWSASARPTGFTRSAARPPRNCSTSERTPKARPSRATPLVAPTRNSRPSPASSTTTTRPSRARESSSASRTASTPSGATGRFGTTWKR